MSVIADLRTVLVHRDFRKLFSVRLVSQCGDGMFQAGLATLFFFSPQNLATAGAVAAAFAVLLLPFTIVGPFAGPLLDRWRRRQVLAVGNAIRVVLGLTLAVLMATQGVGPAVYVLALLTLGVNRFLLAALSAGLPRVVPREQLLMANTLTPTLGAVSAVAGAGLGFGIGWLVPAGPGKDGLVLATAAVLFGCAALLALRMGPDLLGPTRAARTRGGFEAFSADVRATLRDLVDGAGYLIRRRTPGMALAVMALHRFLYGLNFIALILISRNLLSEPTDAGAGLAMFAVLTSISFAGNGLAIVATPIAHERMSPSTWIVVCLGLGAVSQILMAAAPEFAVIAAAAVLMGLAVQGAKIAVDTIVQRDTHDSFRGRAFSLYDMLYNAAFAGAAALAAAALPDTGWSRPVFAALAVAYVVIAVAYRRGVRRVHDRPVPVLDGERTPV
ncbi:MFS transporter [Occultella gossypii]|uniref:MFS transporter n=1 Tax=Occultella gossypii TaxID=2800820 RepID=A0ABS7SCP3_9MICO|nr:MFS transporter [Occultella gossypii]MBZ2197018.1 MFS transporter [Occultella gossypii]